MARDGPSASTLEKLKRDLYHATKREERKESKKWDHYPAREFSKMDSIAQRPRRARIIHDDFPEYDEDYWADFGQTFFDD